MQVFKAPKTNFLFFLIGMVSLLSSCSKEHDLVSEFVIAEKNQLRKVTDDTTVELLPSNESKQIVKGAPNLGK